MSPMLIARIFFVAFSVGFLKKHPENSNRTKRKKWLTKRFMRTNDCEWGTVNPRKPEKKAGSEK
ncbi:MAG: hypothetical protein WA705_12600 [Candidatus Ozemobacteraceae bacterium]